MATILRVILLCNILTLLQSLAREMSLMITLTSLIFMTCFRQPDLKWTQSFSQSASKNVEAPLEASKQQLFPLRRVKHRLYSYIYAFPKKPLNSNAMPKDGKYKNAKQKLFTPKDSFRKNDHPLKPGLAMKQVSRVKNRLLRNCTFLAMLFFPNKSN